MSPATGIRPRLACAMVLAVLASGPGAMAATAVKARPASGAPALAPAPATTQLQPQPTAPRRIDAETAVSPLYPITARPCRNLDKYGSEGEDFLRQCPGYGDYALRASGFDYRVNYGIQATARGQDFTVMLFPLEDGPAGKYARADLYDEKLTGPIEWRLNAQGKPYAVIVRAAFYKNIGSKKTFSNPRNKVAEFLLVRGLAGFETLQVDVPTTGTAYDPLAQARTIAREFLDQSHR